MAPVRRPKFGPGEIIILFILGVLGLIVFTGNTRRFVGVLFSPTAVLLLVVMLFEYLVLRGADRTDIYKRELEAARQKRRDDLLALREMEEQVIALRRKLDDAKENREQLEATLAAARQAAQNLHEKIRERI